MPVVRIFWQGRRAVTGRAELSGRGVLVELHRKEYSTRANQTSQQGHGHEAPTYLREPTWEHGTPPAHYDLSP